MAHEYAATVRWQRDGAVFTDNRYSRGHVWAFDGGVEVPGSSSPLTVRPPFSQVDAVDPEEAVVAATSSCHMLFFLAFAAKEGFVVDAYVDDAVGLMAKNADGKAFLATITLRPAITFSGEKRPSEVELAALHRRAHDECYIANSLKGEVVVAPAPIRFG